jgi:hypothetical protein
VTPALARPAHIVLSGCAAYRAPMNARRLSGAATAAVLIGLLAGCSSGVPGASTAANGTASASGERAAPGEAAGSGGEAPAVPFTHPSLHYTVSAPGTMAVAANGDATYTGAHDDLTVALLTGAADPISLASVDARGGGVAGFALVQPAQTVTVASLTGASVEFTKDGAQNPVTGKPQTAHVLRVYLPGPGGVYRLEYGATVSTQDWDPQGSLDLLKTFRPGP